HFPLEKLDGLSPGTTSAIKPGYFRGRQSFPERDVWQKQEAPAYADRAIFLNPQDPAKPEFLYASMGEHTCQYAKTREDAAAAVEFLKIVLAERIRLGEGTQQILATRVLIEKLGALPAASSPEVQPRGKRQ
ncbi:MAG: hypothetical protein ACREVW_19075, partial [Burkholderiales bacterium]